MWKRRNEGLKEISFRPPWPRFVELCHPHARPHELDLFWPDNEEIRWRPRMAEGADADRAVKHLVDSTNFWSERQSKHLVILAYLYQTTGTHEAWNDLRPQLQTLRLAVDNHRA